MRPGQIFISYRRDDASGYARAVYDTLARHFGAGQVFMDVDDIGAGQRFSEVIERAVGASSVLVVLIGSRWRGERPDGSPRLFEPDDLVCREVAAGLAAGALVVPVLLDGTTMPTPAQLPAALQPLAARHALPLSNDRFAEDMARLVEAVRAVVAPAPAAALSESGAPLSRRRLAGIVGGLGLGALAVWAWRAAGPGAPGRPPVNGRWQAEITYDWPNANYVERFEFDGEGSELWGSASYLRVPRGLFDGRVEADTLHFATRTQVVDGERTEDLVHRYRGRLQGERIDFEMQTEGGSGTHLPLRFVAHRDSSAAASAPAGR